MHADKAREITNMGNTLDPLRMEHLYKQIFRAAEKGKSYIIEGVLTRVESAELQKNGYTIGKSLWCGEEWHKISW